MADLLPQNRSFLTVLSGWFQRTEQQRSPAVAEDLIDSGIVTAIPIPSKPSFLLIILYRLRQFSYENASAEDDSLTPKQTEYALSLVYQLRGEYELAIPPSALTVKDLNRLIAYPKFKNKGILVNLVKKG
ncbi:hypothetical protein ABER60_13470 [Heyndrickxia coagulans]|uniref:hypothetical protein n=1 Tax=Heyndrickxia TaxID=2837504 RepID=UPI0030F7F757